MKKTLASFAGCLLIVSFANFGQADTLFWDGDGTGVVGGGAGLWNTTLTRWSTTSGGSTYQAWINANVDSATFSTGPAIVTVNAAVTVNLITTSVSLYTINGGSKITFSGTDAGITANHTSGSTRLSSNYGGNLTKSGTGKLYLDNTANTTTRYIVNGGFIAVPAASRIVVPGSYIADCITLNGAGFAGDGITTCDMNANIGFTIGAGGGSFGASAATCVMTIRAPILGIAGGAVNVTGGSPFYSPNNTACNLTLINPANSWDGATTITSGGTLTLAAAGVIPDTSALTITSGTLDLATFSETVNTVAMSGSTALIDLTGTGSPTLTASSYSVSGGTISFGATGNLGAGGTLTMSGGTLSTTANRSPTTVIVPNAIKMSGSFTISASLSGAGSRNFALGGAFDTTDNVGTLTIRDTATAAGSIGIWDVRLNDGTFTFSRPLVLGVAGDLGTVQLSLFNTTGNNTFTGVMSGPGNIRRSVSSGTGGTTTLSAANTYSGTTAVNNSILKLGHAQGLGFGGLNPTTGDGSTTVSGGSLDLNGQTAVNEIIVLNGNGVGGTGALTNSGSAASLAGGVVSSITMAASATGSGAVTNVVVTVGGSGYTAAPTVAFSGGGGSGAAATATVTAGAVTSVSVSTVGAGYTSAPTVSFSAGGGSGAAGTASMLIGGGSGYTSVPTVSLSSGGGSGATATATLGVQRIDVTAGGSGYTVAPTVTFTGTSDNPATATATVNINVVKTVTVSAAGTGYTSAPTVGFTGGGGSGATATATLSGATVGSVTVTAGGSGYTSNPTVTFTGGGGSGATATAVRAGPVTAVTVIATGSGYTSVPTIGLTGGAGTAAAATAFLKVYGVTLTAAGSGYTSAPTVGFSASGGSDAAATANLASVSLATSSTVGGSGDITIDSVVSGPGALTKAGVNTLTLTAAEGYSGNTTVNVGTLALTGTASIANTPTITVAAGATFDVSGLSSTFTLGASQTLNGSGTVNGDVTTTSGSAITPGSSAGTLTLDDALTLVSGAVLNYELTNSPTIGGGVNDLLVVNNGLTVNGNTFNITVLGAAPLHRGTFRLINYTGGKTGSFNATPNFVTGTASAAATIDETTTGQVNLVIPNSNPTASNSARTRLKGSTLKVDITNLLATATSDVDGDTVTLQSVTTSVQGVTPTISGNFILYTPINDNDDSFTYTVADGNGGTATATISITVLATQSGLAQNITVSGDTATVTFAGIPGYDYVIERATNVTFTLGNRTWPTNNVPPIFQIVDDFSDLGAPPAPPAAYYRLNYTP